VSEYIRSTRAGKCDGLFGGEGGEQSPAEMKIVEIRYLRIRS